MERNQDFEALVMKLYTDGPHKIASASGRRVRAMLGNEYIFDTTNAFHVWEHPFYPQYYIPAKDFVRATKTVRYGDYRSMKNEEGSNIAVAFSIEAGGKKARGVEFEATPGKGGELDGLIKVEFDSMDQWYEEDTPIYVHPKDPTKRIDLLSSQRTVEIKLGSTTLAKSTHAIFLIEPLLPVRYYIPQPDCSQKLLRPSQSGLKTKCPYKGEAEYLDVVLPDGAGVVENVVWWYRYPTYECAAVAGMYCFFNEKVDVFVNGVELERPKTHFA
ncbi:DUF427-domain-containing protein [Aulographum hederae CBS 113979]|uniref:DUF427-domain-containing protein n=1 Tax=Aulographum hederae CBS 113979 TaxID=1176131 RepID=A0A6G1HEU2_9PEZI|nr:DUF427-domain-containing protein [Aulographum hederae CBS 113979]